MIDSSIADLVRQCLTQQEAQLEWPRDGGIAIAIVDSGQLLYEGVFGLRDRQQRLPVTRETLFDAGSITKGFTSAVVVNAARDGRLHLDAPLQRSITTLRLRDTHASERISLADLLTHRSGLPSHDFLWLFSGASPRELTSRLRFLEPIPGAFARSFVYSNLGYAAAGVLYEDIVEETIEQAIARSILHPLGMRSSVIGMSTTDVSDVACPHSGTTPIERRDTHSVRSAAGLRSSITDLAEWVRMLLRGGVATSGQRILADESIQAMFEDRAAIESPGPVLLLGLEWIERPAYGLGWMSGDVNGHRVIFHTGFIDGFSCVVGLVPSSDFGMVVLTNVNLSGMPGELLRAALEEQLDTPIPTAKPVPPRFPGGIPDSGLAPEAGSLAGTYEDPAYGLLTVRETATGASLYYGTHEWPITLVDRDEGVFAIEAFGVRVGMPITFDLRSGRAAQVSLPLSLDPRVPPQRFARV